MGILKGKKSEPNDYSNLTKLINLTQQLADMEKQREKLVEELRFREKAFNDLALLSNDWVFTTNEKGVYDYVSPKTPKIYGFSPSDMLGKKPSDFLVGEYKERAVELELHFIETHDTLDSYVTQCLDAYGNTLQVTLSAVPMFDHKGNYKGHLGIERSIIHVSDIPRKELMIKLENNTISMDELKALQVLIVAESKLAGDDKFVYSWLIERIDKLIKEFSV